MLASAALLLLGGWSLGQAAGQGGIAPGAPAPRLGVSLDEITPVDATPALPALDPAIKAKADALFDDYAACMTVLMDWARDTFPKEPGDSDFVYKSTIKAKACDAARGIHPAVGAPAAEREHEHQVLRRRNQQVPTLDGTLTHRKYRSQNSL